MTITDMLARVVAGVALIAVMLGCWSGVGVAGREGNPWKAVVLGVVAIASLMAIVAFGVVR